jgi:LEA14-like dessication related protein
MLAGCAGTSAPTFNVTAAQALERTPDGVSVVFDVAAQNDNDDPLPLREVEYTLDINGQRAFAGTRSAEATLRRNGSQTIRLPAVVNLARVGEITGPARYRLSGTVKYVTPGQLAEIFFDTGVRIPTASFSGEGEVDLAAAKTLQAAPGASFVPLPDTAPPPVLDPVLTP